jgi:hypothetical protein
MIKLSELSNYINYYNKIKNYIHRKLDNPTDYPLTGTYCVCWQHNPDSNEEYEVGAMRMNQVKESIHGEIFAGDKAWSFTGEYLQGRITAKYNEFSDNIEEFILHVADGGRNFDRLFGKWTGTTKIGNDYAGAQELLFFAARGEECSKHCHARDLTKENNIGLCLQKKQE